MTKADPLDDTISSVELLWSAGAGDLEVVNDARESFEKEHEIFQEPDDERLIKYLARHRHWTPFAGSYFKFRIKMPIFVAREWFRHNVIDLGDGHITAVGGFTRNEVSRRYVDTEPEFWVPKANEWRLEATDGRKQGSSSEVHENGLHFTSQMNRISGTLAGSYRALRMEHIAPELARIILPFNMYTEFRESASLFAYANLCAQRIAPGAQKETRLYAESVEAIIEPLFPISWKYLKEYFQKIYA